MDPPPDKAEHPRADFLSSRGTATFHFTNPCLLHLLIDLRGPENREAILHRHLLVRAYRASDDTIDKYLLPYTVARQLLNPKDPQTV